MNIPSLRDSAVMIPVPRWLSADRRLKDFHGKRVWLEWCIGKYHQVVIEPIEVLGPNEEGRYAVDVRVPCPKSVTSLRSYIFHFSLEDIARLKAVERSDYQFRYDGPFHPDHPFTTSFPDTPGLPDEYRQA